MGVTSGPEQELERLETNLSLLDSKQRETKEENSIKLTFLRYLFDLGGPN